jgi:hypothetical protein
VLSLIGMVAMMTMTAGRAQGQLTYVCEPMPCATNPPADQSSVPTLGCIGRYPIPFQQAMNPLCPWSQGTCAGFPVNREPAVCIQFTDPSSEWRVETSNPRQLRTWWHAAGAATDTSIDVKGYTGNWWEANPFISGQNTIPDQIEYLIWELDRVYAAGFRRIILNLPAGVTFGMNQTQNNQTYMIGMNQSLSQWWAMPAYKRSWFEATTGILKSWKDSHTDVQFGLYTGFGMSDSLCSLITVPNSVTGTNPVSMLVPVRVNNPDGTWYVADQYRWVTPASGAHEARDFDPRIQSHIDYTLAALEPWRNSVFKINQIWLDAASDNVPTSWPTMRRRKLYGYQNLSDMPVWATSGLVLRGEAVPIIEDGTDDYDWCAVYHGPWLALGAYFDYTPTGGPNAGVSRFDRWTFSCNRTEVHYVPDSTENCAMTNLVAARERGMVVTLINQNPDNVSRVQRLYSMGIFRTADFDGNGTVNWDDRIAASAALNAPTRPFISYQTGDFNGDGIVVADTNASNSDWNFYLEKWNLEMAGSIQNMDYGRADFSNTCE